MCLAALQSYRLTNQPKLLFLTPGSNQTQLTSPTIKDKIVGFEILAEVWVNWDWESNSNQDIAKEREYTDRKHEIITKL